MQYPHDEGTFPCTAGDTRNDEPIHIALWGTGADYRSCINQLYLMQEMGKIVLEAVMDTSLPPLASLDGIPVVESAELPGCTFDYLIVANARDAKEIIESCVHEIGIPKEKILTHRILSLPGFDFGLYHQLRISQLSVISDNAWAAGVCRKLQMQCLSPFRFSTFKKADYLRLLSSFDQYLAIDDIPYRGERYDAYGNSYFSFELGDIEMRLTHSKGPDEALDTWLSGRKKLNDANMFVKFSTCDPAKEEAFGDLDRYQRKVCFVPYETRRLCSMQLPLLPGIGYFDPSVDAASGLMGKPMTLDLVRLLLGQDDARRFEMQ